MIQVGKIEGLQVKNLQVIPDERGWLMEILRSDDDIFKKFVQVYMTTAYPGVVKGWHYHKIQTDNFTCINGMMKVVLYDSEKTPQHMETSWNPLWEIKNRYLLVFLHLCITASRESEPKLHIFEHSNRTL